MAPKSRKVWVPLESNPDVLNKFVGGLGLDTDKLSFHDVLGLDEELLAMVPQPVHAVVLCYPLSDEVEASNKKEDEDIMASNGGQPMGGPAGLYYMKQTIGNACGTIAVLHSLGNNSQLVQPSEGSFLQQFLSATAAMAPDARGQYLEDPPEEAPSIEEAHQAAAAEGDSRPPGEDEDVLLHYVALVHCDGRLWQLDGRRPGPIDHGPTTPDTLLVDGAEVVKKFVERTNSISFNVLALCGVPA